MINRLQCHLHRVRAPFLAFVSWLAMIGTVWAQKNSPEPASSGSLDYTLGYFLVILGTALGLLTVLQASHRRERAGPEGYVQKNVMKED